MRMRGVMIGGIAVGIVAACTDDPANNPNPNPIVTPTFDGGSSSGSDASQDAGTDAVVPKKPAHAIDALDPTKGSFAGPLGKANAIIVQGIGQGMADPERVVVTGDPIFIGAALDRMRFAVAPGCQPAVTQFPCPPDTDAKNLLGQVLSSRSELKGALVEVTRRLERWKWIGAAATALEYVHLLEQTGKLDDATKTKLTPLANALATDTESFKFADLLTSSAWLKSIYGLAEPGILPTEPTSNAARDLARAVRALYETSAFTPFDGADTQRPQSGSAAWHTITRMSRLGTLADVDPAVAVEAYLVSVDGIIAKAQAGTTDTIDWASYVTGLSAFTRGIDASLNTISHLAPSPPLPSPPSPSPSTTGKGTLEDDPRAFYFEAPLVAAAMPATTGVGAHLDVQNGFDGADGLLAPARLPSNELSRAIPARSVALDPAYTSYETACSEAFGMKTPCDALWLRWLVQANSTTVDHVDVRITRSSDQKQVFHHLYRPRGDGMMPRATLFYPQVDDPDLGKNATTIYAVELVVVGASGVSEYVCASTYVTNGAPPTADVLKSACEVKRANATHDYFADPLATAGFVIQEVDGVLKMRPQVVAAALAPTKLAVWNETGDVHRIASLFTPPYGEVADIGSPTADLIHNTARLDTGLLPAHEKKDITTASIDPGPFLWTIGEPSHRGALGGVIAR